MRPSIPILAVLACAAPAAAATSQKTSPVRAVATANRLATVEPTPTVTGDALPTAQIPSNAVLPNEEPIP